jgi:hypothetical protein
MYKKTTFIEWYVLSSEWLRLEISGTNKLYFYYLFEI